MMHYSKVVNGILTYIDSEIVGKLAGSWKGVVLSCMAGIFAGRAEAILTAYRDNPIVRASGLVDGENVDVEALYGELRRQIQKGPLTIAIPILGPVTFDSSDVESLYRHIKGGMV
jgi:hypothetical protein